MRNRQRSGLAQGAGFRKLGCGNDKNEESWGMPAELGQVSPRHQQRSVKAGVESK
jgi:hypothetical protein